MKRPHSLKSLPIPVKRALNKLGHDIRDARRRRRISTQMMAERALISRMTLHKIEKGDASVAIGFYGTVLFVLGLSERLQELLDVQHDITGQILQEEFLPKRIRISKKREK